MSAFGGKADMPKNAIDVAFGEKADKWMDCGSNQKAKFCDEDHIAIA